MAKVTAGRDELGAFAPKFAEVNDDILFGEIWSREDNHELFFVAWSSYVSLFNIKNDYHS